MVPYGRPNVISAFNERSDPYYVGEDEARSVEIPNSSHSLDAVNKQAGSILKRFREYDSNSNEKTSKNVTRFSIDNSQSASYIKSPMIIDAAYPEPYLGRRKI